MKEEAGGHLSDLIYSHSCLEGYRDGDTMARMKYVYFLKKNLVSVILWLHMPKEGNRLKPIISHRKIYVF